VQHTLFQVSTAIAFVEGVYEGACNPLLCGSTVGLRQLRGSGRWNGHRRRTLLSSEARGLIHVDVAPGGIDKDYRHG